MKRELAIEVITALLILLYAYAAISKLLDYSNFVFQLTGHALLKEHAEELAWMVPAVELVIAVFLFINRLRKIAFSLSFLLLAIFTGYIIYMFVFYPKAPCSCGGVISRLSWQQHLVFNGIFMALNVIVLRLTFLLQ